MKAVRRGMLALAVLAPATARAIPPPSDEVLPPPTYRLNFQAGEVELDDSLGELVLSRNVVVQVDRYRLTSERLHLRRTSHGIVVDGSGEVAFCPCPDPPVTLGFRSALVAPPTDLLIEQPTLRVGGIPVFWLPYAWLRAPNRIGLLPPRFEWRQSEGFVAGSGVHVPIDATAIDVFASGYFNGGARVSTTTTGSDAELRVVWDHYRQSALVLDGRGSTVGTAGVVYAYDIDARRGARGRTSALSLDEAALRVDHASAGVSTALGGAVFGTSMVAQAVRGGAMDQVGLAGPRAVAAFSTGLARVATFESALGLQTLTVPGRGAYSIVAPRTAFRATARPGPLSLSTALGAGGDVVVTDAGTAAAVRGDGGVQLSLPLQKRWGAADSPWAHVIEPLVSARALVVRRRDDFLGLSDGESGQAAIAAAGIRTAIGTPVARQALEASVRGGWVVRTGAPDPAMVGDVVADSTWLGTAATAILEPGRIATLSELRVGQGAGLHLLGFLEGRRGLDPLVGRWLARPNWDGALGGFFDRSGWTTGADLVIPWTRWLATEAQLSVDASTRQVLAYAGSVAYRHRCGCLALQTWAGHRLGREGQDAWLTVDLMP